jgi:hypothetical protein
MCNASIDKSRQNHEKMDWDEISGESCRRRASMGAKSGNNQVGQTEEHAHHSRGERFGTDHHRVGYLHRPNYIATDQDFLVLVMQPTK